MNIKIQDNILSVDGQDYQCIVLNGEQHITANQLSEISNYHPKTIRKKISSGVIPVTRQNNGRVLISLTAFLQLVEEGRLTKYYRA